MLARCVATLKPPPELTLSQWADRYRMLSAESSAEPGRWHTDKAPYQREIMDAIGDAHIRRVVIMCAAQLGKTELLLNILGYFMAYAPAPILVMQPTLDMGQTFSKDRLAPMIRDTPVLRGLVDVKSRYAGNTILKKNFPGGHITIVGANSATGLASRPIKVLLADEVDRYPGSAGTEGDPLSLAQKRQTTFWDKKTVMVSTPVIKGHSRIETEYNQSTREEWNVPCPECGHYQPFVWANLIFDPDDLQKEIIYKCERCGCVANEYRWKQQSQQGRFVAENPGAETRGFHLNTLASTFCGWKEIVQKFIVAKEQLDQGKISALYAAGDMTRQDFYRRVASIRWLLKHTESASLRWRLNEIYRAELEKAKQKQLREEAQHEPFADHSGVGNGDGNAGTGYQDHGDPACRKKKHKYKKVKKNKSASRAPAGESIEQRPEEIDEREEFGHWEGDTVYSGRGKRKTTRALLTLTERKTRKEIIIAIPNRKAETVVKALDALERKLGARRFRAIFKSITFDNGTEFAAAEGLERSCVNKRLPRTKVYFCHPYSSWERGTNENTNGMIRRRFPKGTNFAAVTNAQIAQAENWINNYPRKILGYKSSEIVFRECLRELGIAA